MATSQHPEKGLPDFFYTTYRLYAIRACARSTAAHARARFNAHAHCAHIYTVSLSLSQIKAILQEGEITQTKLQNISVKQGIVISHLFL